MSIASTRTEIGFDPEFPTSLDTQARMHTWNALHTLNLAQCDLGLSPTVWQRPGDTEVFLDPARTHFTGRLSRADYRKVLQISAVHVYLTYPFVLSWSLFEALSTACLVIGLRTAIVEEVIRDEENGVLVDFFDIEGVATRTLELLEGDGLNKTLRERARMSVKRFDITEVIRGYEEIVMVKCTRKIS